VSNVFLTLLSTNFSPKFLKKISFVFWLDLSMFMPEILNGIKIGRLWWCLPPLNPIVSKEFPGTSGGVFGVVVLHEKNYRQGRAFVQTV
jgi:hypothetical protein